MQNENFTPSKQNLFFQLSKHIFKHKNLWCLACLRLACVHRQLCNIMLFILLVEYHPLTAKWELARCPDSPPINSLLASLDGLFHGLWNQRPNKGFKKYLLLLPTFSRHYLRLWCDPFMKRLEAETNSPYLA